MEAYRQIAGLGLDILLPPSHAGRGVLQSVDIPVFMHDMSDLGDNNAPATGENLLFGLALLVSGRTSVRYRFGSPFSSKKLFVDTVL